MDTREDAHGLLKEAKEDLARAARYSSLMDWVTVTHYAQLAIEKSAKAVIACFEAFEWTHDPSEQMERLAAQGLLSHDVREIGLYAREAAPWHGRSTYGGPRNGRWQTPSELCTEAVAADLLGKARKCADRASAFIEKAFQR
ncbi:MAG: HEPN domain-containing protein [Planctomycetes bacterium]|nr:HEPN domain-containing protein [Planctomycetota bacterium]